MLFNSQIFILGFLPVTLAGFFLIGRLGNRQALVWLLACSLFFYGWWKPPALAALALSIAVNFWCASKLSLRKTGRFWLFSGIVFNLILLAIFKYANFLASLFGLLPPFGGIWLPLGISFFSFQQIMFLADIASGQIVLPAFLDCACFIAFFPHLVSGPIVRPSDIIPQFTALKPVLDWRSRLASGLEIFLLGLAKKLVLADGLARFADPGFAAAARLDPITLVEAWVALLAYALQIYFDFSGYSDMAIGLARMFGITFPVNFNSPYKARNISDFWRRWNITLSRFLRDYLYIPLGGNQRGQVRRAFNVMITMLLGGLWHGAALKFILWGALHGLFLFIHGFTKRVGVRVPGSLAWLFTFVSVVLAWVPFRAAGLLPSIAMFKGLLGMNGIALPSVIVTQLPGLSGFVQAVPVLPYLGDARTLSLPQALLFLLLGWFIALGLPELHSMSPSRRRIAVVSSFALTVQTMFVAPSALPFLYFQF